jgi:hypothetical protein
MRVEDCFDFLVSASGSEILYSAYEGSELRSCESYLINFAISAALLQRGEEPLHSTVIRFDKQAIGLIGDSGAGKSTLAAFLRTQGGDVVTDDILRVRFAADECFAEPGQHRLKLFEHTAQRFFAKEARVGCWSPVVGKFVFELGSAVSERSSCHLSAIYHLAGAGDCEQVKLEQLAGSDAFLAVCSATMFNGIVLRDRVARHFQFVRKLTRRVPVYRLIYPRRFDVMNSVFEIIRQSLRSQP